MTTDHALLALSALSHPTRLSVFRLLVKAGPSGLPAGVIAADLNVRQNTLSTNLAQLTDAGLITRERDGRIIRYAANMAGMNDLILYLMEDCCGGDPKHCAPVLDAVLCKEPAC